MDEDAIHLWFAALDEPIDDALLLCYERLLDDTERARWPRFHFARDRHRFLVTRALLRTTLSRYVPVEPAAWRFEAGAHGRPFIAYPRGTNAKIVFNLSHADRLAVLAVARRGALGVDVENFATRTAALDVAASYFSREEAAALAREPPENKHLRFFEYWTFKESYIKARGLGLSLPLDEFSFRFAEDGVAFLSHARPGVESPRWRFWQFRPTTSHLVALCAERRGDVVPAIHARWVVPLRDERATDAHVVRVSSSSIRPERA